MDLNRFAFQLTQHIAHTTDSQITSEQTKISTTANANKQSNKQQLISETTIIQYSTREHEQTCARVAEVLVFFPSTQGGREFDAVLPLSLQGHEIKVAVIS